MKQLKQKKRVFSVITDPKKIDHILRNHVDFNDFYVLIENRKEKIRFHDRHDDNSVIISLSTGTSSREITLFTVRGKYIEFATEMIGCEKAPYPENTLKLKIRECRISADSRAAERYSFPATIKVTELVLPAETESKNDLLQNTTMKILLLDIEKSLGKYSYGKVFLRNAESIPPEVQFVEETDILLYLTDTSKLRDFIEDNKVFFSNKKDLLREMLRRVPMLQNTYRSIIIQPIEYLTLNGNKITLGHIMIASKDSELNEDDLISLGELCSAVFEKLKSVCRKSYQVEADVSDISPEGIRVDLGDRDLVKKMVTLENMMFSLKFPFQKTLAVSGNIIHITENTERSFQVGIDFTGSRYGVKLKKMIEIYIQNLINLSRQK